MIDARAVVTDLGRLGASADEERQGSGDLVGWMRDSLQSVPVRYDVDTAGNQRVTLQGAGERTVLIGAYLEPGLESRIGLVTAVETLKALAHRFEGPPPCKVELVLWSGKDAASWTGLGQGASTPAAYLELQMETGTALHDAGNVLGVAVENGEVRLSPRLTALAEEAIQELTGGFAAVPAAAERAAAALAGQGVPAAVMYLQAIAPGTDLNASDTARLHVLEAAEAFGRWTEATVHLVAGDEVDLWALEHRVPHS